MLHGLKKFDPRPNYSKRQVMFVTGGGNCNITWSFIERQLSVAESNWNRGRKRRERIASRIQNNGGSSVPVWDLLYPSFNCPFNTERIGRTGDGKISSSNKT